jgi:putative spermidine/putrescine transport system permease protein
MELRVKSMMPRSRYRASWSGSLGWVFALASCLILVLPGLILIPMSFTAADFISFPPRGFSLRWYRTLLVEREWRAAFTNSLLVALGATAVALAVGVPAAVAMRRIASRFLSDEGAAALPLAIPSVVLGAGLYRWYLAQGWVGSVVGLICAHAVLGAPLVILTLLAALRRIDPELENAATTLGASRLVALWTVTLPLALPGIVGGAFFAFITSFDEIAIAFFLTDAGMKTLPKLLFDQATFVLRPTLAVTSTVLILVSVVGATFAVWFSSSTRRQYRGPRGRAGTLDTDVSAGVD